MSSISDKKHLTAQDYTNLDKTFSNKGININYNYEEASRISNLFQALKEDSFNDSGYEKKELQSLANRVLEHLVQDVPKLTVWNKVPFIIYDFFKSLFHIFSKGTKTWGVAPIDQIIRQLDSTYINDLVVRLEVLKTVRINCGSTYDNKKIDDLKKTLKEILEQSPYKEEKISADVKKSITHAISDRSKIPSTFTEEHISLLIEKLESSDLDEQGKATAEKILFELFEGKPLADKMGIKALLSMPSSIKDKVDQFFLVLEEIPEKDRTDDLIKGILAVLKTCAYKEESVEKAQLLMQIIKTKCEKVENIPYAKILTSVMQKGVEEVDLGEIEEIANSISSTLNSSFEEIDVFLDEMNDAEPKNKLGMFKISFAVKELGFSSNSEDIWDVFDSLIGCFNDLEKDKKNMDNARVVINFVNSCENHVKVNDKINSSSDKVKNILSSGKDSEDKLNALLILCDEVKTEGSINTQLQKKINQKQKEILLLIENATDEIKEKLHKLLVLSRGEPLWNESFQKQFLKTSEDRITFIHRASSGLKRLIPGKKKFFARICMARWFMKDEQQPKLSVFIRRNIKNKYFEDSLDTFIEYSNKYEPSDVIFLQSLFLKEKHKTSETLLDKILSCVSTSDLEQGENRIEKIVAFIGGLTEEEQKIILEKINTLEHKEMLIDCLSDLKENYSFIQKEYLLNFLHHCSSNNMDLFYSTRKKTSYSSIALKSFMEFIKDFTKKEFTEFYAIAISSPGKLHSMMLKNNNLEKDVRLQNMRAIK